MKHPESNGNTQVKIDVLERVDAGYALICPRSMEALDENLPVFLSQSVEQWLAKNPDVRVRCTLPIVQNGQTVAIHVWYDRLK